MPSTTHKIVLIFPDHLSPDLSSLAAADPAADLVLFLELRAEAINVSHHKKKLAFLFSAMRHFADELRAEGWSVDYVALDDPANTGELAKEVKRAAKRHGAGKLVATEPGDWRQRETLQGDLGLDVDILPDTRFLCDHEEFEAWANGRKQLRMEYFYREMRRKTGLLMDGDAPEGGEWNYDKENRKPADEDLDFRAPPRVKPDAITKRVLKMVEAELGDNFGDLEPFWFAVTRKDAEKAADHFIAHGLPDFGDYQDAMVTDEAFLFHSVLSFYINAGLLDPLELCRKAEGAYEEGRAPLNAVEGFIRQIIGWREYIRGIYWLKMPDYQDVNHLGAERPLPDFYWTGETDMKCLSEAIGQTKREAYAHHIQRLMVTGLFALLIGVRPKEIHEWYLAVYADAFEWVELPNVIGMSQYADGGLLASKPYAASGAYINRMSNHCETCAYKVHRKTGDGACPFNYLYWDFIARHTKKLAGNPRMGQMYATWGRMKDDKKKAYRDSAKAFLETLG
ncbi:MAG: cryptochrome/photolyase family protein [Pseudomonadota bacterium]